MATTGQHTRFPIGTPDKPWGEEERQQWRDTVTKKRDYFNDVVSPLMRMHNNMEIFEYGSLDYRQFGFAKYPLYAVKNANWDAKRPMVLVTGGVHGYEASGVHGAMLFLKEHFNKFTEKVNILVLPCISPWGYETINRWNPEAIDPNRSFVPSAPGCTEAALAMATIILHIQKSSYMLMHTDLHETTDTDNSEFIPAKAARDGLPVPDWDPIPDGFYLIGYSERPQNDWHAAMINAVKNVTHIAPGDKKGCILGKQLTLEGVLHSKTQGLCKTHTDAKYQTTTEVYPDSANATDDICNLAQMTCVVSGLEFAMKAEGL